ncbi:3-hydroxyisobutyrate dehydrogenase/2-hydroxy-3-oxopropionate reductase [Halomicrobium zhouii]|uniref:3-hydroxyisobutyrate dehydrogenase/2-hydroxy-3-oxopropionate reductase n=1 Tax=Halomicrobium zhouii TaxID=767519 RepID=A0A1I6LRI6_9EURY|nr:NAD(P)-dependent oxidoreductase [Halomicrobium zhouii]SFS06038.1 3-hydroxyisobutyrate dehydrogenase/2-hydroxy-3-oxopropionate reductase [Halomicrobium zhouii]
MTAVGFVGLGAMGAPMAWNLVDSGFDLTVYNRTTERERPFAEAGVSVADSPKHLTERVDVVCLIVSDGDAVAEVLDRDLGILAGVDEETTVVQMSTIGHDETAAAADAVTDRGGRFVDCPVSGTVGPAEEGTLVGLASGDEDEVESVRPVLETTCDPVVYCGDVGQGTNMKLFINLLLGDAMSAFAEALTFGANRDLSVEDMLTVVENGALDSPLFSAKGEQIADGDFAPRFPADYQFKDLNLALDAAGEDGVPMGVTAAARELFSAARGRGHGDEDMAAVVRHLEETTGVEVRSDDEE